MGLREKIRKIITSSGYADDQVEAILSAVKESLPDELESNFLEYEQGWNDYREEVIKLLTELKRNLQGNLKENK